MINYWLNLIKKHQYSNVYSIIAETLKSCFAGLVLFWLSRTDASLVTRTRVRAVPGPLFQPLATGRRARAPGAPPLPAWRRDAVLIYCEKAIIKSKEFKSPNLRGCVTYSLRHDLFTVFFSIIIIQ